MRVVMGLLQRLYSVGSIKVKVMGIVLGLALILSGAVIAQARSSLEQQARDQLRLQAVSVAQFVAARGVDLVLTHNVYGLRELLRDTMEHNPDLRYVVIYGTDGRVLDSTFGREFPAALMRVDRAGSGINPVALNAGDETIYDVAVPMFEGRAGIARVGVTDRRVRSSIWLTVQRMLIETALISAAALLAAYLLTLLLARPLEVLVAATKAVGAGDLSCRPRVTAADEIGLLSASFNSMLDSLQASREELKAKEAIRAELVTQLISAQEAERKRIALELHDQTGQLMTSMMVGLKLLEGTSSPEQARERIAELRSTASTVLEEVHSLALELRPPVLDDLGLVHALDRYTRDFSRKYGVRVDMQAHGFAGRRLPAYAGTTLYRISQEALTNVARHSGARNVSLSFSWSKDRVTAIIHDDGRGFDPLEVQNRQTERLGLFSMRERAKMAGGRLELRSEPGQGTTIVVQVPAREVGEETP